MCTSAAAAAAASVSTSMLSQHYCCCYESTITTTDYKYYPRFILSVAVTICRLDLCIFVQWRVVLPCTCSYSKASVNSVQLSMAEHTLLLKGNNMPHSKNERYVRLITSHSTEKHQTQPPLSLASVRFTV
jgi:hypothetical protein